MPLGIVFAREALEIIPFFRQQGIEVIAAPLDSARRAGDNSDPGDRRYRLWALPGLPGGEAYRQRASDKTRMIREVNDAIARLQRERRSGSMPVTGEWERFNP